MLPPDDWPHRAHSRIVAVPPHRWHVQVMGDGPDLLFLHGAGSSTHTFAAQLPAFAKTHRAIAIDLPGQGYSQLGDRSRCGLDAMSEDIGAVLRAEAIAPQAIVAHSAGAAIALNLASHLDGLCAIVALNGALENFPGPAGVVFPAMAKMLAMMPGTARTFSMFASGDKSVERLIGSTGSRLSEAQLAQYQSLVARPAHVDATLMMMASWDLAPLLQRLPRITTRAVFLSSSGDSTVRPQAAQRAAQRMPHARFELIDGLGHMMHEEAPEQINPLIRQALESPA